MKSLRIFIMNHLSVRLKSKIRRLNNKENKFEKLEQKKKYIKKNKKKIGN